MTLLPFLDTLRFLNDIACDEAVGNLITTDKRIVIDAAFEGIGQFLLGHI